LKQTADAQQAIIRAAEYEQVAKVGTPPRCSARVLPIDEGYMRRRYKRRHLQDAIL